MKELLEMSSFYISVLKIMVICYTVPDIWHVTDVTFIFNAGLFSAFLPPNSPKKSKVLERTDRWTLSDRTLLAIPGGPMK